MRKKKFYEDPFFEICDFKIENVVTLSGHTEGVNDSESDFSELLGIEGANYGL